VKTALSSAFILITVLLFWFGMVQTKSENEKITQNVRHTSGSLNLGNDNKHSKTSSKEDIIAKKNDYPGKRGTLTHLLRQEMSTAKLLYRAKKTSGEKGVTPREALDMHRRVLDGKLFLQHLTQIIESSANAKKVILGPFSNQSIALGNDALTRSLFSIVLKDSNGSETIEVSSRGKTPEASRLLSQLIYRAHAQMIEQESAETPLLPVLAELASSLKRKEKDIEELRRQIQQRQSAKPVATVEEISLRAERDQCEKELVEHVEVLSVLKEAREKGASSENLASLSILSNKGNLADFSDTIEQLRKFRNSPKAKNKAIREELDHQIAQAMQKLETELTTVITSLKEAYSKTSMRRDEVRSRLVTIAKATSSRSKSNPRFQLLEKREREVLSLQERYELTLPRWQEAKLLVTVDDRQKGSQ
jgi:hypothetical protein